MIVVKLPDDRKYELRWISGDWRDKAGHVWKMASDGTLSSLDHNKEQFPATAWSIESNA